MPTWNIQEIATQLYTARSNAEIIPEKLSDQHSELTLDDAYTIQAELVKLYQEKGYTPNGYKIGFASKALIRKFGLSTVAWANVYDKTVHYFAHSNDTFSLAGTIAPKIEPEIVFKLKEPLTSGSQDASAVLAAAEWYALGFEIVDCVFPNWGFKPIDFVATVGFHIALLIGEPQKIEADNIPALVEQLQTFQLKLLKNGEVAAEGGGKNVLGNPALCLGELAEAMTRQTGSPTLAAGDVITSGTTTDPQLILLGEEWAAEVSGIDLPILTVRFK